jgi:DNA polymerase-3 subunit alpha
MAFVTLEDLHGSSDVTVFSPPYTDVYHLLAPDTPIFIQGHVQKDEKSAKVLADNIILVEEAAEKWISEIYFNIDLNKTSRGSLIKLHDVLMRHKGDSKGYLCMTAAEKTQTIIALPDTMKLSAGKSLIKDVMEVLGYNGVEMR